MKFEERKKLEEIGTKVTGIKPLRDKEYVKLTYIITEGHGKSKYKQKRSNLFVSKRRYL